MNNALQPRNYIRKSENSSSAGNIALFWSYYSLPLSSLSLLHFFNENSSIFIFLASGTNTEEDVIFFVNQILRMLTNFQQDYACELFRLVIIPKQKDFRGMEKTRLLIMEQTCLHLEAFWGQLAGHVGTDHQGNAALWQVPSRLFVSSYLKWNLPFSGADYETNPSVCRQYAMRRRVLERVDLCRLAS